MSQKLEKLYRIQQGSSSELRVADENAWYLIKETIRDGEVVNMSIIDKYDRQDEAWSACEKANEEILIAGRPPMYDNPMRQVSLYLRQDQIEWLQSQPEGMAATIRKLIDEAMKKAGETK